MAEWESKTVSPFARKHRNGPWFVQTVVDQDFAARSIQTSHFDGVAPSVGPVHVPGHPVYSQPVRGLQTLADHSLHATAVQVCAPSPENKQIFKKIYSLLGIASNNTSERGPYHVQGDVGVVNFPIDAVVVQRDDVVQLRHWDVHVGVVVGVQGNSSYADSV